MELNNLIFKKCIKFITEINLIHHLLSAYVYVNVKLCSCLLWNWTTTEMDWFTF